MLLDSAEFCVWAPSVCARILVCRDKVKSMWKNALLTIYFNPGEFHLFEGQISRDEVAFLSLLTLTQIWLVSSLCRALSQ